MTHHMRHNVVAYLALFLALSGTAIAAKPLVDGADVQDASLTGADVQNDSLTGDDVLESSLGKVGDADTLDGKNPTDFAQSAQSCDTGETVTGISASGAIVCTGGGGTPEPDLCDGVDDDNDGTDGEDDPRLGEPFTDPQTGKAGVLMCVDGGLRAVYP